jgi:hypothetical protein
MHNFKKIEEALDFLHVNRAEWDAYERYLDQERSFKNQLKTAKKEGALEIARCFFDVLDIDVIAEKTGLSIADLEELRNNESKKN